MPGETSNIARIAEKISDSVFNIFGWRRVGPLNHNWRCVLEAHGKQSHPSDVVFEYDDPYSGESVYVTCDLKSYARSSITKNAIAAAMRSLLMSTECANLSPDYRATYVRPSSNSRVLGLLFVYNHDGAFDSGFPDLVSQVSETNFKVRRGNRIFLMGPETICYLATIANDILARRGGNHMPPANDCYFYYPDLVMRKLARTERRCATAETLLGPRITVGYPLQSSDKPGYTVYVRSSGAGLDEFVYLFDFLFHYQLLESAGLIEICLTNPDARAPTNFEKAKDHYWWLHGVHGRQEDRFSKVHYRSVTSIVTQFDATEIGMEERLT